MDDLVNEIGEPRQTFLSGLAAAQILEQGGGIRVELDQSQFWLRHAARVAYSVWRWPEGEGIRTLRLRPAGSLSHPR